MRYLQPLILRESYITAIEQETQHLFDELIYRPLVRILNQPLRDIANSISALLDAIRSGSVWYFDGEFHGEYSSTISKELRMLGAQYNTASRTWALEQVLVPAPIKFALVEQQGRIRTMRHDMLEALGDVRLDRIDQQDIIEKRYQQIVGHMEQDFTRTVSAYQAVAIQPQLTTPMRELISEEWATNLNLYIKGWTKENIVKLRTELEPFVLAGGRAESLRKVIEQNYEVSRAKAKFLARQETSLLMSKFRQSRYADVGIEEYKWSGAMDARERPDHRELEGKIFRFDKPPITNLKTSARNNPGEDYGCRCLAIPRVN